LYASDPEQWMKTIADPMLWRIIEQKDYKPIMDLLNEQQRAIIKEIHQTYVLTKIGTFKLLPIK
ncbi:unnamed protein product, partial [Rotaria socialis]